MNSLYPKTEMERKLLAAVDGSIYSRNTLHYLETLFRALPDVKVHLLCVVPGSVPAPGSEWLTDRERLSMLPSQVRTRYNEAGRYLEKTVTDLGRAGIGPDRLTTEVKLSGGSIARDILGIARQGLYDALIIGRRGLARLEEMILGSVSQSILGNCRDVPLWIIDGKIHSNTFLVPVDGAEHTLLAVDHLAFILKDHPTAEITLFHSDAMFAQRHFIDREECYRFLKPEWCDSHLDESEIHFAAPEQLLIRNGFPAERIHRKITNKGIYPSRQIVRQALIDDFGTIVMGRRPQEMKTGVFGSVSEKVLAMAVNTAVWIVG